MSKLCPSCGASTLPGGRFCRVCGAPLRSTGSPADGGGVSPGARTIPLAGEGRPTSRGIKSDEQQGPVVNTSKVKRSEMDDLLRRPRTEQQHEPAPTYKGDGSSAASDDIHRSAPPTNELTLPAGISTATATPTPVAPASASRIKPQTRTRRAWPLLVGLALVLALVAALVGYLSSRGRNQSVPFETTTTPPAPVEGRKKLFDERLAEAATLLEAGRTSEAIALLRSAIELEPTNAEAHRRLGEALEKSGERAAALEEYRISTRSDQNNADAWRALASVQLAEGLFNDSAESYRRFIALKGETEVDDDTWLDYGQALLLAGHTEEARAVYQRVASSPKSPDSASKAKRQLAQLPLLPSINTNTQPSPREPRAGADMTQNINAEAPPLQPTPSALPTPQPTVQPTPAPTPTTADNAPQNDPDYYYNRGLNIVSGRDLKSLPRAELLQALEYFQRAQSSSSTHRAEASRYVQQLGREYDRRKKQPQQ